MRINYWAHSKIVKKLRIALGFPKPLEYGSSKEWREYEKACIEKSPFLDKLTDDYINKLQDIVCWPKDKIESFSYWIYNRFISPTHLLNTRLKTGEWCETDVKILHGVFEELVDFVELQKAGMSLHDKDNIKFIPWWDKYLPYFLNKLFVTRSEHLGVNYLLWETTLKQDEMWFGIWEGSSIEDIAATYNHSEWMQPTRQAKDALEILYLYVWWKYIRPNRQDPYEVSGYNNYFKQKILENSEGFFGLLDDKNEEDREESRRCSKKCHEIEEQYEKEDEEMLIKLIKIRRSLWT